MAKTTQARMTPRLRFPNFRKHGGWETTTVGAIATILKGKGIAKSDVVPDGLLPCIRYGELYTRYGEVIDAVYSRTNAPISELFLSRKHDVLIPASGETKLDIATAACVLHDGVALGSDLNVLRTIRNGNGIFLSYLLNSSSRKEIARVAQGETVVHLYPGQLQNIVIALPDPSEQQKIAECLMSLDAVIAAQAQKVEALKVHKRGLIQRLFPRDGGTIPRVHFCGSDTRSSWRLTRLGDVLSEPKRKSDGFARVHSVSVHKGLIDQIEHLGRSFAAADTSKYSLVKPFDVVYTKSPTGDFPYGIVKQSHLDHDAIVSPLYGVFTPINQHVGRIIEAYFDAPRRAASYLAPIITKGAKNTIQISNSKFLSKGIPLPGGEEEQRQVAGSLAAADACIAAATGVLEALRAHKTGLVQQLFPSPDAA